MLVYFITAKHEQKIEQQISRIFKIASETVHNVQCEFEDNKCTFFMYVNKQQCSP